MRPFTRANRTSLTLGSLGLLLAIAGCQTPETASETASPAPGQAL